MISPGASNVSVDVVVVGSGAAGLTTAITARLRGLSALVLEKTDRFGGTTALSGGGVWIPNNFHHDAAGLADNRYKARSYLDATVGERVPIGRTDAYLDNGPQMLRELHDNTAVRFVYIPDYPDYYAERIGGYPQGRSLEPEIFDLNRLAPHLRNAMRRAGLPTYGMTMTTYEFRHLNMIARTWKGRRTAGRVATRAVGNLLTGKRTVTFGEALIARMLHTLDQLGAQLWHSAEVTDLITEDSRVGGVRVATGGRTVTVHAARGVMLASGGFSQNQELREKYLPTPTSTTWTGTPQGQTGDAVRLALSVRADLDLMDKVWGGPMIVPPNRPPFFLVADRAIPRMIIVNQAGQRYVNEAVPYHEFVDAMYAANRTGAGTIPSWLILDTTARSHYMFAGLLPRQPFPRSWIQSGFVKKAATVGELADQINADPATLHATVERFNRFAKNGVDPDYHRGTNVYDRYYGDPTLANPNLAPLIRPPFYAVPIHPGDIGTKGGPVTNEFAQVLREDGTAIEGLYASGNASSAVMGTTYPGPGSTIGPAMAFGWVAANHMARTTFHTPRAPQRDDDAATAAQAS